MLRVINAAPVRSELLELSGYTLSIRWNNPLPTGHVFWRTGNFKDSLIECGLNAGNHTLEVVKVVNVRQDWISIVKIVDFDDPRISKRTGLPVFEWTHDKPSARIVDESGNFSLHIASNYLTIRFGDVQKLRGVLAAQRSLFGVNDSGHFVAIQLTDLTLQEVADIKSTFRESVQ